MEEQRCTICRTPGPYTDLKIAESDEVLHTLSTQEPTCVFNPCGHVIDLEGATLWSRIKQPGFDQPVPVHRIQTVLSDGRYAAFWRFYRTTLSLQLCDNIVR
jgi:hypothetical protein